MPRSTTIAATAAMLAHWSAPASACDTGPWPVEFNHGSIVRKNTDWGNTLASAVAMREWTRSHGTIRLIVYNSGASSPALWEARIATARSELTAFKVPARAIELVRMKTQGGMVGGKWIGRTTKMTVELARGCGR